MMDFKTILYIPLGILPLIFFSSRMILQWWTSEKKGKSIVTPTFWKLSLAGNATLFLHYTIQLQIPFALFQVGNGWIAYRNLQLMRAPKRHTRSQFVGLIFCVFILFFMQYYLFSESWQVMRVPKMPWINASKAPFIIQIFGFFGGFLFASRFYLQWWRAERMKKSELSASFWIASFLGSLFCLTYFIWTLDMISIAHYAFALLPALRNLWLIRRKKLVFI